MIDYDIYCPNADVERLLESFNLNIKKEYPSIKYYISTASSYNDWLEKLYSFYNNTNLMEAQKDERI